MGVDFSDEFDNAKVDAGKFDADDILAFGIKYFICGYRTKDDGCYYNHSIAVAFAIIGKLYSGSEMGGSNYHKGVAYIARELNISKRQVKVLRKQFLGKGGYVFKIPYKIHIIVSKVIELLADKEDDPMIIEFLSKRKSNMYREILIGVQYAAIMTAAPSDTRVNDVYGELKWLTKKVG